MRKMFLVTYLIRNERFLRFLLNMYLYFEYVFILLRHHFGENHRKLT